MRPPSALPYRPELDGLRAVAVAAVLFFHAGAEWARSGFVGVDVFFVLSGYLMTRIIVGDGAQRSFDIWRFYARRVRRILPAFYAMLLGAAVVFSPLLLTSEINEFGRYLASSSVFLSNVYYALRFEYFSAEGLQNPLLHTWSIAVEVQFYLIAPILFITLLKMGLRRAMVAIVLLFLSLASLFAFGIQYEANPQAAYYSSIGRFWEFGFGGVMALISSNYLRSFFFSSFSSVLGLALIVAGMFGLGLDVSIFEENILLAVAGTCLILASSGDGIGQKVLSTPPLLFLGKISYSVYLIHWPVFVAYKMWSFRYELNALELAALIGLVVFLSWLSWRLIEVPFNKSQGRAEWSTFARYAVLAAITLTLGVFLRQWNGIQPPELSRLSNYSATYIGSDRFLRQFEPKGAECFVSDRSMATFTLEGMASCWASSGDKPALYLVGDSHAAALAGPVTQIFSEYDVKPIQAVGCRFLVPIQGEEPCRTIMTQALEQMLPGAKNGTLILASKWTIYESDFGRSALLEDLSETIRILQRTTGHKIIVVGPNPEFFDELPTLLARADHLRRSPSKIRPKRRSMTLNQFMRDAVVATGATYVDVISEFCTDFECDLVQNGEPLHFDSHHLIDSSAQNVASAIKRAHLAAD